VTPDWVLTAAHCAATIRAEGVEAVVGATRLSDGSGVSRMIDDIRVHPDYQPKTQKGPDVALLHLAEPIDDANPVALIGSSQRTLWEPSDPAIVIGWGATREGGSETPDQLQQVQVEIQADDTMASPQVYGSAFVANYMVGAGTLQGGRDSCQGDSGGPLLVRDGKEYRLVGVVSWGVGCGRKDRPGVYARLGEGTVRSFVDQVVPDDASGGAGARSASGGGAR